jgi:hypothetical protein
MEDIAEVSSNPIGFAVLRLLLRKFPDRKYLDMQNEGGLSVIHFAALHSNIHALEIIHDHLVTTDQHFDPNTSSRNGATPLHGVGLVQSSIKLEEEDNPALFAILKKNTARTYEFLRSHGAYYLHERAPLMVCIFSCAQNDISPEDLRLFLETVQERSGIEWEIVDGDLPHELVGTDQALFAVELCWVFDRFMLRATPILTDDFDEHCMERRRARSRLTGDMTESMFCTSVSHLPFSPAKAPYRANIVHLGPWMKLEYEDTVCGHLVQWTRPGQLWRVEQLTELVQGIASVWLSEHG